MGPCAAGAVLLPPTNHWDFTHKRNRAERVQTVNGGDGGEVLPQGTIPKGVSRFEVLVTGRAAHAGTNPEQGVSAIPELSHLVQRLFALSDPATGVTVNVGTIDGGL